MLTGSAVGEVGEGHLGETAEFRNRGVALENLANEQVRRDLGRESPPASAKVELAAPRADQRGIDESRSSAPIRLARPQLGRGRAADR
jgi:hypothetical protein